MLFSVVTPSFRNSHWLKLCIASVADQMVQHEHIVQDSCSDDGTGDWLPRDPRVQAFIEKDQGMYDAVNRGFGRARGDILSYLNCDEQYLPGALAKVERYFQNHPEVEVLFADALVVGSDGKYLCHRQATFPTRAHTMVSLNLSFLTCATFMRRSVIDQRGLLFNPSLKDVGDADWGIRLGEKRVKMGLLGELTSTFTETGMNRNLLTQAKREQQALINAAPAWARICPPLAIIPHRLKRFFWGHYRQWPPFHYQIYTLQSPDNRVSMLAEKPTFRWQRSQMAASSTL